jgi:parvulin-like peptidyl-prolyl isomerase
MIRKVKKNQTFLKLLVLLLLLVLLAACNGGDPREEGELLPSEVSPHESTAPGAIPTATSTAVPPSPTVPPPTPTPLPAALVNGQPILIEDLEKELKRYQLAQAELGIDPNVDRDVTQSRVLEALIERELIRQAADVNGISISQEMVEKKLDELRESASEYGNFDDWLTANQWTLAEFSDALKTEMMVEEMVASVTADVPSAMEQVRARYIQVDDLDLAQFLLGQIGEGSDFAALAERYSLDLATAQNGGDLGFFSQGSLLVPEVESAAFELKPDEISDIIIVTDPNNGQVTYYLVQLIERESSRMLGADLRYRLMQEAFETWMEEQKTGAIITILLEEQGEN